MSDSFFKMFSIVDGKLGFYEEKVLSLDEVRNVLLRFPCVLPFTSSKRCYVLRNVPLNGRFADLVIVVKEKGGLDFYVPYFNWYSAGSTVETTYPSAQKAYWDLGVQIEDVDEELMDLSYKLRESKSKQARELKNSIRELLGVKRIKVNNVIAVIVVDKLTKTFEELIDAINEMTDMLIYAMELRAYCKNNKECVYIANGYE